MGTAFHTLALRVSHDEHKRLKDDARQLYGGSIATMLRIRLGLPRIMVREGEQDAADVETLGHVAKHICNLQDAVDADNMLLTMIARKLGIEKRDIEEAKRARSSTAAPTEFAGGFIRR